MKIKRTVKKHYYDRENWPTLIGAGETEFIDQDRMEKIIRNTRLGFLEFERGFSHPSWGVNEALKDLREKGKIETFAADYELVEA